MSAAAMRVIYSIISTDSVLSAMVGDRIFPNVVPNGELAPSIEYHRAGSFRDTPIGVEVGTGLVEARIAVTAIATDYALMTTIGEGVRNVAQYRSGTIAGVQVVAILGPDESEDIYDEETGRHFNTAEYLIRHYE